MASGNDEGYNYTFAMKSSKKLFDKFEEFLPAMLVKNHVKSKGFFDRKWSVFNDFSLRMYYRK